MESFDLRVRDFNLGLTLSSGQVFHWATSDGCHWHGMLGKHFYHLHQPKASFLRVHTTASPSLGRQDLSHYFGLDQSLQRILKSFPKDPLMREATHAYKGLRLLRQDPWVTLASFILSSTKQILQIRQTVQEISCRFGSPHAMQTHHSAACAFPDPAQLVQAGESRLRACRMGYRAKYLYQTACLIQEGQIQLDSLRTCSLEEAREVLMQCPGVGPKIAECVLLFGYGFQEAFPMDVWIRRILEDYYLPGPKSSVAQVQAFVADYFGPHSGYAQQYLFDHVRNLPSEVWQAMVKASPFAQGS